MLVRAFGADGSSHPQVLPFDRVVGDLLAPSANNRTLIVLARSSCSPVPVSDVFYPSQPPGWCWPTAVAFTLSYYSLSLFRFEGRIAYPGAARACLETLTAVPMLVLFTFVDRRIGELVNRWIFRAPDYRTLLRELSEKLARLRSETEIADAVATTARQSLELRAAQLVTLENLSKTSLPTSNWPHSHGPEPDWLNAVNDGELVELDCQHPYHAGRTLDEVELLVPVRSEGRVTHMLAISPGPARRGLVTHEVNYLRSVAAQCGHRLDALHMEERLIVVQNREAVLQQQVTEAELRALRAQVNPHFLFGIRSTASQTSW
jgi:two-component system LytT family sensor kinase